MKTSKSNCSLHCLRELAQSNTSTLSTDEFKKYYFSENYETYFIEYFGDIVSATANLDYAHVFITGKFFAILSIQKGMLNTLIENVSEITSIGKNIVYTLSELKIVSEITTSGVIYENDIPYDGEGIIVGIIGTGIDYLNPRFTTETGESRILAIWDQTISTEPTPEGLLFGIEYSNDNINQAIRESNMGNDPYKIVAHRDDSGHGTAIAGLIGGRSLDEAIKLKSVAPKCEFAIVKLVEAREDYLESIGIEKGTKNVYQGATLSSALHYLSDLQVKLKKPMVVYIPMGSNFGGRDGSVVLEKYIDNLTNKRDFCIVTDTGNQGMGHTHASGTIKSTGETEEVFINVGEGQRNLAVSIYTKRPDIILISITSPLGNTITKIPMPSFNEQNKFLTYEENGLNIEYFAQEQHTGTVTINMVIKNTTEGVWKISLFGEYIAGGIYDAWILHSELLKGDTRFLTPEPYTTLLTPSTSVNIIVTTAYNGIDNSIMESSGKGFPRHGLIHPSIATSGVNLLTVGLNNSLVFGSGAAMAGAILAGAVALIYQWGIEQEPLFQLYSPLLKNLLIAATIKDDDKIYPNREWGYGRLSINKLYGIMVAMSNSNNTMVNDNISSNNNVNNSITTNVTYNNIIDRCPDNGYSSGLYINIPMELFRRINN